MTIDQRLDIEYYLWEHGWSSFKCAWEEFCSMTMDIERYKSMHNIHWVLVRGTYLEFLEWLKNSGYCESQV